MLRIEQLTVCHGSRSVVESLSFDFPVGSVSVLLGPNGAGKSTLLQSLIGLQPMKSGDVFLQGRSLQRWSRQEICHRMAWQGAMPDVAFGLTVRQRLQLACLPLNNGQGLPEEPLHLLELHGLLDRDLAQLSSGERQRIEIAAMVVRDCPIWLLDEPATHLDLKYQVVLLALLRRQAAAGKTIVCVLHDLQQAQALADQVLLFSPTHSRVEHGSAEKWLTRARMEPLYQTTLHHWRDAHGGHCLLPDYGSEMRSMMESEDESTR
ncbi:MAG: ABC transporter ATP-binding protein [Zetaproteobacteria bacterium]|nr:ABC transporter ATP-binding protein [Zetaproteobacteria bacterium]